MTAPLTILHVDDDPDELLIMRSAFEATGVPHDYREANNGFVALQMLEERPLPGLIILDINMPKMDGKETFATIKANISLNKIPVVILSNTTNESEKEFFVKQNVPYFNKTSSLNDLINTAMKVISIAKSI